MSLKSILSPVNLAMKWQQLKWKIFAGGLIALGLLLLVLSLGHLFNENQKLTTELALANAAVTEAADRRAAQDNLISSLRRDQTNLLNNLEGNCRAQVQAAYDAGATAPASSDRLPKSGRERQVAGAFRGSVPATGGNGSRP